MICRRRPGRCSRASCRTARRLLHRLREKDRDLRFEVDADSSTLTLDIPEDLRQRFASFPREVIPGDGRVVLTEDLRRMQDAIEDSRRDEAAWPRIQYLWRLSPVVGWLNDRMLAAFGRHEAPVLAGVPGLASEETVYVLSGLVPNPPWVKVAWEERGMLGDYDPLVVMSGHAASELAKMRDKAFNTHARLHASWIGELEQTEGMQAFLNGRQNYPLLAGQQTNLFKCFLPQSWMIGSERGVAGFLHPEGVYDDPKGRPLRAALYPRLRIHFQFRNERKLFPVDHHTLFSINVYGRPSTSPRLSHISNLYVPFTIDACFDHDGRGMVPGIKDDTGDWNISGHRHRVINVDGSSLTTFAELYDAPDVPAAEARLPALHSRELLTVLRKMAAYPLHLNDLQGKFFVISHWHETASQKDGTIRRETRFSRVPEEWILSGPHYFVGNPLYKTPRSECTLNSHYDVLDQTVLPEDYLPRTNYGRASAPEEYVRRTPRVSWVEPSDSTSRRTPEYYRRCTPTDGWIHVGTDVDNCVTAEGPGRN